MATQGETVNQSYGLQDRGGYCLRRQKTSVPIGYSFDSLAGFFFSVSLALDLYICCIISGSFSGIHSYVTNREDYVQASGGF